MSIQFLSDENGRKLAVQVPIEEWEKIKAIHPDVEYLSNDLPQWQKKLIDKRLETIKQNPNSIKSADDLFQDL